MACGTPRETVKEPSAVLVMVEGGVPAASHDRVIPAFARKPVPVMVSVSL